MGDRRERIGAIGAIVLGDAIVSFLLILWMGGKQEAYERL